MGRALAAIAALSCGGCNALLGLDPTELGDDVGAPDARRDDGGPPIDHDEDGDGIDDAFDVCPHVADPGQEDVGELVGGVADGVGDACDPRPQQGGDSLVFFDPFDGDSLAAGYYAPVGGWFLDTDALQTAGADEARVMLPLIDGQRLFVQAALAIGGVGITADSMRSIGLWEAVPESPAPVPPGYQCMVRKNVSTGTIDFAGVRSDGTGGYLTLISTESPGDPTSDTFVLQASLFADPSGGASSVGCSAEALGDPRGFAFADATYASGRVGVHVDGLAVTIPYVAVYVLGP